MFHCLIALIVTTPVFGKTEWVDPFDMNTVDPTESASCKRSMTTTTNVSFLYYKRIIRLLLETAVLREDEYKGQVNIRIPIDKYGILKDFMDQKLEDAVTLQAVDKILSYALTKTHYEKYAEEVVSWIDRLYFAFYTRQAGVIASCLVCVFVCYKLLRANLTIGYVVKYLLFLGWVVDFAFTWINLLQVMVCVPNIYVACLVSLTFFKSSNI